MQIEHRLRVGALALAFILGACADSDTNTGGGCDGTQTCEGNVLTSCNNSVVTSLSCSEICGEPTAICVTDPLSGGYCECDNDVGGTGGPGDSGWATGGGSTGGGSSTTGNGGSTGPEPGSTTGTSTTTTTPDPPCLNDGISCENNGQCCGFDEGDALCVGDGETYECAATCTLHTECSSGCCVELTNGGGACAPSSYCEPDPGPTCQDPGYGCEANSECCDYPGGAYCVNVEGGVCAASCSFGFECNSGCCVELNNGDGACLPPEYCGDISEPPHALDVADISGVVAGTQFSAAETEEP